MASLAELSTVDLIKILVYGDAGAGKTIFAAGFPVPILYCDFDGKLSSAARFYAGDQERLKLIEHVPLNQQMQEDPMVAFNAQITQLIAMQKAKNFPFKTLVIDSITTFSSAVLAHIVRTNPGINRVQTKQGVQPGRQDYGILKREFQRLIPGLLTLEMNVVMLGHISVDKDELTGELVRGVLMDGSFSQQLPIYFEEVYRAFVEEKAGVRTHMLQTRPDRTFTKLRSQIPGLPAMIPAQYSELNRKR